MTIILDNDRFKYEIEAVVKIFFPAEHFHFEYENRNADGDICAAHLKIGKKFTYAGVCVRVGNKQKRLGTKIENSCANYENSCETAICRCIYICFSELTGKVCKWGMLTGVRPAKLIRQFHNAGMSRNQIFKVLCEKYFVSEEKARLAYDIFKLQQSVAGFSEKKLFSLYVSIPFCPSRCSYCSFISHSVGSSAALIPEYTELLKKEIELLGRYIKSANLQLETVYFGGGTPTTLSALQLSELFRAVEKAFDFSNLREYTVEAGRPDTITEDKLRAILSANATRISVNPQTTDDGVLKKIGRNHTADDFFKGFELAGKLGFRCINTDIIAGLPSDTVEGFSKTVDDIVKIHPENVTVHSLTLKKSAGIYETGASCLSKDVGTMIDISQKKLTKSGYLPYYIYRQKNTAENLENVGYSISGFECLYNIYIMDDTQTIIGAGCGASTKLVRSEFDMKRFFNYKYPFEYIRDFDKMNEKKKAILNFQF